MARNEQYPGVLKTPYSIWHRSVHNGVSMTDIDKISQCPACGKCLVIADLIFNVNDQYKTKPFYTKKAYLEIAKAVQIPFFEVYYTTEGKADIWNLRSRSIFQFANLSHTY